MKISIKNLIKNVNLLINNVLLYILYKKEFTNTIKTKVIESPHEKDWLPILNSVDLGIQLRENFFAFSSGCVAELIAIGKPCLISTGMVSDAWHELCTQIESGLSVEQLANEIMKALNKKYNTGLLPYNDNINYWYACKIKEFLEAK